MKGIRTELDDLDVSGLASGRCRFRAYWQARSRKAAALGDHSPTVTATVYLAGWPLALAPELRACSVFVLYGPPEMTAQPRSASAAAISVATCVP